jgi:hypothetical protein
MNGSSKFDQIQVRENELDELKALMEVVPCQVKVRTLFHFKFKLSNRFVE